MSLKRSELVRKTPMPRSTSTLKAKAPMSRSTSKVRKPDARPKSLKTRQRAVTREEKALWDRLATEIGCVACMKDGQFNPHVSIHHIDGRTKPGCHQLVLPLCAPHHQHDDTDQAGRIGVHPWSARFERQYGEQHNLLKQCMEILERGK